MSFDSDQSLKGFVCRFLKSRGAIVEKTTRGFNALLPERLAERLETEEFVQFDTDSTSESTVSINYGSPFLEKIIRETCQPPPLVQCQLEYDYLKSQGFDNLIQRQFRFYGAVGQVESFAAVRTEYLSMTCNYLVQSDEQREGLIQLRFNLETGARIASMEQNTGLAVTNFKSKDKSAGWSDEKVKEIVLWVKRHIETDLLREIEQFQASMNRKFRRDVTSLKEYYAALKLEMKASLARPGLSDHLIQDRQEKIDLLPDELAQKIDDLLKKYSIRVKIKLCAAMLIQTRAVKILYRLSVGREPQRLSMIYNPSNKSLDPQVCRSCGISTFSLYFCTQLHPICPSCKDRCSACRK